MEQKVLHEQVWTRFIRMPYGHLLDYADRDGNTVIPTASQCEQCLPNALGWWTPIENGAFFTGLYLTALVKQYTDAPDEQTEKEIGILVNGLKILQDAADRDGFICRGVADDGKSHYPLSSEDQVAPWVLGMYAYHQSPLCRQKDEIKERILRTINGIENRGWHVPCDTFEDSFTNAFLLGDWRSVCKLLLFLRVKYELTKDADALENYRKLRDQVPDGQIYTRAEIASHGFSHDMVRNTPLIQFWIDVCAHLSLRWLSTVDEECSDLFRQGLKLNGVTALQFVCDIKKYDNDSEHFALDWQPICEWSQPFTGDVGAAIKSALGMCKVWSNTVVPHRHMEHAVLGNALFAAWIAVTSGDAGICKEAVLQAEEYSRHIDWSTLTLSYAFAAESVLIYSR